jgi:hypothetical protein
LHQAGGGQASLKLLCVVRRQPFEGAIAASKIEIDEDPAEIEDHRFVHGFLINIPKREPT